MNESARFLFQPVNPSHHVIDAVFVPSKNSWILLYTEQRNGQGYLWQQKFNENFDSTSRLQNNATQVNRKMSNF